MREEEDKKATEFRLKEEWHKKMQQRLDALAQQETLKEKRRREALAKQQVSLDELLSQYSKPPSKTPLRLEGRNRASLPKLSSPPLDHRLQKSLDVCAREAPEFETFLRESCIVDPAVAERFLKQLKDRKRRPALLEELSRSPDLELAVASYPKSRESAPKRLSDKPPLAHKLSPSDPGSPARRRRREITQLSN